MELRWICASLVAVTLTQPVQPQSSPEQPSSLLGYSSQAVSPQKEWEKKFRDGVVPGHIRENMRRLSARPHHVGSAYDRDNAEWILAKFKEWGFDAHIETFNVLFPTPKERIVEMTGPTKFRAKLQELWRPRRIRRVGSPGNFGERGHRDCPLRRGLARDQAESGG